MKAACRIQNGIVCIILFLSQNIAERVYMESCVEILGHICEDYVIILHIFLLFLLVILLKQLKLLIVVN